jgi:hypothetical protein
LLVADRAAEYEAVSTEVDDVLRADVTERRRVLRRLRAELRRIERRDYFPPLERQQARRSVAELAATLQGERVR